MHLFSIRVCVQLTELRASIRAVSRALARKGAPDGAAVAIGPRSMSEGDEDTIQVRVKRGTNRSCSFFPLSLSEEPGSSPE